MFNQIIPSKYLGIVDSETVTNNVNKDGSIVQVVASANLSRGVQPLPVELHGARKLHSGGYIGRRTRGLYGAPVGI